MSKTKNYTTIVPVTNYWKPNTNFTERIIRNLEGKLEDGDIILVSEKAVSTAIGNLVDESKLNPSWTARLLAKYWMRFCWTYLLGPMCHLPHETIHNFQRYPVKEGSRHKQAALQHHGFLQALMPSSEGGIDSSNLPYSYVSLPLHQASKVAEAIRKVISSELRKRVVVLIGDTDKTYSWKNFHFTPRPKPIKGLFSMGGFISYIIGRFLKLRRRATPLAIAGAEIHVEEALRITELGDSARGVGAGKTVWHMAAAFHTSLSGVSWEMLESLKHEPLVIIRPNLTQPTSK